MDKNGYILTLGQSSSFESQYRKSRIAKYAKNDGAVLWEVNRVASNNRRDEIYAQTVDADGNVIVIGFREEGYSGYAPSVEPYGYFTAKYQAADGALIWEKYSTYTRDAVAVDSKRDVYVVGNGGNSGFPPYDTYVRKLRGTDGETLWIKAVGSNSGGQRKLLEIATDLYGNVIVLGRNGSQTFLGNYSAADGRVIWEKTITDSYPKRIAVDDFGGVLLWSNQESHTCLTKFEVGAGAERWKFSSDNGGSYSNYEGLALDSNGNAYLTGDRYNEKYQRSSFTAKVSGFNGALVWKSPFVSEIGGLDGIRALTVGPDGHPVVVGFTQGDNGLRDYYTAKYNTANGGLLLEGMIDAKLGSYSEESVGIAVQLDGSPVIGGSVWNSRLVSDDFLLVTVNRGIEAGNLQVSEYKPGNCRFTLSVNPLEEATTVLLQYRKVGYADFTSLGATTVQGVGGSRLVSFVTGDIEPHTHYEWKVVLTNTKGTTTRYAPTFAIGSNANPVAEADGGTRSFKLPVLSGSRVLSNLPVLDNDKDADGDVLRIISVTQPENGMVRIVNDGQAIEYEMYYYGYCYADEDRFTYTISDGFGGVSTAEVTVQFIWDTAPKIVGLPASPVLAAPDGFAVMPDLTSQVITDSFYEVVSITQDIPAGTGLPPGEHLLYFFVTDTEGQNGGDVIWVFVKEGRVLSSPVAVTGGQVHGRFETNFVDFGIPGLGGSKPFYKARIQYSDEAKVDAVFLSSWDWPPVSWGGNAEKFQDPVCSSEFSAYLSDTLPKDSRLGLGLWRDGSYYPNYFRELAAVVYAGNFWDPNGGARVKSLKEFTLNEGSYLFWTAHKTGDNFVAVKKDALFAQPRLHDTPIELLEDGQVIWDGYELRTVKSFLALQAAPRCVGDGRYNGGSATCALVTFQDGGKGIVILKMWAPPEVVVVTDRLKPLDGMSSKWRSLSLPAMIGESGVVFKGALKAGMPGVENTNDEGIFTNLSVDPNGQMLVGDIRTIVRAGNEVGEMPGVFFKSFSDPTADANGNIAFFARIRGKGVTSGNSEGLFYILAGESSPQLVARMGDKLTELKGSKIRGFKNVVLHHRGGHGPVFKVSVYPSSRAASKSEALLAVDSFGEVRVLAQAGDPYEINGETKVIRQIGAMSHVPGSSASARTAGEAGQVIYRATFTDHTQAIIQITVP